MADDTPTKSVPFLSPSSDVICIICYEDLQKKYGNNAGKGGYKINLWRQRNKTEACKGLIPRALFLGEMRIISPVSSELRLLE